MRQSLVEEVGVEPASSALQRLVAKGRGGSSGCFPVEYKALLAVDGYKLRVVISL
jgi:hypothetical protein